MKEFGTLKALTDDQVPLILNWRNEPRVRQNMYTTHLISEVEHIAWWEKIKNRADTKYYLFERGGSPYGVVAFTQIDLVSKHAMWAFYTAPDAPKGTGSLMEYLALEHAFNVLLLNRLYCEVLSFNKPVIRLHKKFGFEQEGILREHHKGQDGYNDIYCLGILNREWQALRESMRAKLEKLNKVGL